MRCNRELMFQEACHCPTERLTGGLCFPSASVLEPDYPSLYMVNFQTAPQFQSAYFMHNIRAAHGACAPGENGAGSNLTACQLLGNLCVILLYDLTNTPPSGDLCATERAPCNDACSLYIRLTQTLPDNRVPAHNISHPSGIPDWWRVYSPDYIAGLWFRLTTHFFMQPILPTTTPFSPSIYNRKVNMAWLFYPPNTQDEIRHDTSIPTSFRRGSVLNFTAAVYDVSGHFHGYGGAWRNDVTLCKTSDEEALTFGQQIKTQCYVDVDTILNGTGEMMFFELNMPYITEGMEMLNAIPVLVSNLQAQDGTTPNVGSDPLAWRFVRRFYILDTIAGRPPSDSLQMAPPSVVRYMKTCRLHVTLRDAAGNGEIYVPWLELEYAEISESQYGKWEQVLITFEVVYSMDLSKHESDMSIAIGVLSGIALMYSAFQAHNHNRREGKMAIDFPTILYLCVHLAGTLSNAFFVVVTGASIWWFFLYKLQDTVLLIPILDADYFVRAFLGSAFALKTINIIYLIFSQTSVDLFFMDWERPKVTDPTPAEQRKPGASKVSIWRTYFVANEWNELSTLRSINMAALLFIVTLLLKGVRIENLARLELENRLSPDIPGEGVVEFSRMLRFAISSMIYISTAVVLWLLHEVVWKTFVSDRISAFSDVCSMCNVSTFIMTHTQFGYYVHGRSVHGHADLGMRGLHANLNREQVDLCGSRGLEPGTDHQTFEIALPRRLRTDYNKVLQPVQRARARQRLATRLSLDHETKLEAYDVLNRFLQNFIDHNFPNLSYVITSKNLFEKVMDTEVEDNHDLGYFYIDQGHSFDRTMLYGHEMSLQVFSLLAFTMADLAGTNFVLAATVTLVLNELLCRARYALGRRNIAAKTMVDERLLI